MPTARRPTARPSASSAPCSSSGPTPTPTSTNGSELRLIEDTDDPITLGGDGAEAVFYALNVPNGGSDQLRALYLAVQRLHDELGRKS